MTTTFALRSQLDAPQTENLTDRCVFALSGDKAQPQVISFDLESRVGLVEYQNTGLRRAFILGGAAKQVACRDYQPEFKVEMFDVDTVAEDGGIQAAFGEPVRGRWTVPAIGFDCSWSPA